MHKIEAYALFDALNRYIIEPCYVFGQQCHIIGHAI